MTTTPTVKTPPASKDRATGKGNPRLNWTFMTVLSLAVAGYFVGQYATAGLQTLGAQRVGLANNYAHRALPIQIAFYLHIVFAGLALSVGPFQFVRAIRRRWPAIHRWTGRTYVVAIAFGSVAAFVMSFVSEAGLVGFFGFGSLAVLWAWTTYRGYRAIRGHDVAEHRAWMIRSFALTFAAPTLRLWLGLLIGIQALIGSHATDQQMFDNAYAAVPFLCWLPNIVIAELMIRRRNLPGLRFTPSAGQRRSQVQAAPVSE
ncbi:DUF2306 domain-containing protein [Streptomyces natalensis]|uniref:DUF2306 domain-containing protein n=1 Tax=Streptomyces natalensis TaxID=68242 RepID=UPI0007C4E82C|nr:DUF2306 domain-containing protein [Streptomyces natalensis]